MSRKTDPVRQVTDFAQLDLGWDEPRPTAKQGSYEFPGRNTFLLNVHLRSPHSEQPSLGPLFAFVQYPTHRTSEYFLLWRGSCRKLAGHFWSPHSDWGDRSRRPGSR